jgi:transposase-like protein
MNPVCGKCKIEMGCKKTGLTIAAPMIKSYQRNADKFECPDCNSSVIVNFGEPYNCDTKPDVILVETE